MLGDPMLSHITCALSWTCHSIFYSGTMLYSPYGGPQYGTCPITGGFSNSATYAEGMPEIALRNSA